MLTVGTATSANILKYVESSLDLDNVWWDVSRIDQSLPGHLSAGPSARLCSNEARLSIRNLLIPVCLGGRLREARDIEKNRTNRCRTTLATGLELGDVQVFIQTRAVGCCKHVTSCEGAVFSPIYR